MKIQFFQYKDYKKLLNDLIETQPQLGRGERKKISDFISCQTSFLTHVLSGNKDFNHEQALKIARYFRLSEAETDYFLLLISHNRAGSKDLADHYLEKLNKLREENETLKARLKGSENIRIEDQIIYYSNWLYSVVHMAATIAGLQDIRVLAERIRVEEKKVLKVADHLQEMGLVHLEKGRIRIGRQHLFLDSRSPLILNHHINWRNKMVDLLSNDQPKNLHFTMAFSVSENDLRKVREILVKAMDQAMEVIKPSPEEKLAVFCLDLHSLT